MYKYEVSYRENGILKIKGFTDKEKFEKFVARISKSAKYTEIRTMDNTKPKTANVEKLGKILGKKLNIKIQ